MARPPSVRRATRSQLIGQSVERIERTIATAEAEKEAGAPVTPWMRAWSRELKREAEANDREDETHPRHSMGFGDPTSPLRGSNAGGRRLRSGATR